MFDKPHTQALRRKIDGGWKMEDGRCEGLTARSRAMEEVMQQLNQNTIMAITVGSISIGVGIRIPVFYENQIGSAAKKENTQPCFLCSDNRAQKCRFCMWAGNVVVEFREEEKEASRCINCNGVGSLTCTTCQGSGIQPRYLDGREFKDDD